MPDNVLQFETRVNLSGLESGMAQARSSVSQFSGTLAQAMENAKQATERLASAQRQLGQSFQQGDSTRAVIEQYRKEVDEANAAVQQLSAAEKGATSSVQQLASAEREETAVVRQSMSARMAASTELRVFEGNMMGSTRAAGAFLASLPGIGAAMQAAFPIFGAVALIEVLGQAVGAVNHLIEAFHNLSGAETDAATKAILAGDKIVNIKPEKLSTDAAARFIAGIPQNGPVQVQQAAAAIKQIEYQRQLADIAAQNNEAGLKGKALDDQKIADLGKEAEFARQAAAQAQILIDTYQKQLKAEVPFHQLYPSRDPDEGNPHLRQISDPNQIKEIQSQMRAAEQAKEQFEQDARVSVAKVPGVQNKEDRTDESKTQLQQIQDSFADLNRAKAQIVGHPLTAGEAASFWEQYLATFHAKTNEARTVTDEFVKYQSEQHKQIEAAFKKTQEPVSSEAADRGIAELNKELLVQSENLTRTGNAWKEYNDNVAKSGVEAAQEAAQQRLASIAQAEAIGSVTKLSASHQIAATHAKEYAVELAALRKELADLNAQAASAPKDPVTGQLLNGQLAGQIQGVQNQIGQKQSQGAVISTTDATQQASALSAPYLTAFNDINNQFLQVQQKMILGTRSIQRAFAEMGANLVVSLAASFEKMLARQVEMEIKTIALHQTTKTAQVTTDATAGAASTAISAQTAFAQVTHEAAVAAASTWAALSGIPVIGPVLGAAAAGAAYAGVLALAAFETGGIIPNTGIALVHQGEAVLPANLTKLLLNSSSSSSQANNTNVQINNHGMSDRAFRDAATRNAEHITRTVSRGARRLGMA